MSVPQNRLSKLVGQLKSQPTSAESDYIQNYRAKLRCCKQDILELIDTLNCNHPILIRLAWHDSGTFDRTIKSFPECGGANASIRFPRELNHKANAGLCKAVNHLQPFKEKYPELSFADIIQLASVTAIEYSGGPYIPIRFGRIDTESDDECAPEGNLPDGKAPFGDGSPDAATHLRRVFYRMGFDDQQIVCLSGAHTLGRAFKDRSGTVAQGYVRENATKFTNANANVPRHNRKHGVEVEGGGWSWTPSWLTFDKQYFNYPQLSEEDRAQLLQLSTDAVLFVDEEFKKSVQKYARSQSQFFRDYTEVHAKLAELGSKFRPAQGFYL